MSPCYPTSGDGRVVPTNQSARGDRQGSHRGSAFGSNSQGLHEPARRFEPLLPHEARWVEEQVQRPQGHRQSRQEPPCPLDQEPRAGEDQSRESGRADHHPGSRDRRVGGPVGGVGGGVNKNKTPRRTPPRVGPVPGEGFRGQHITPATKIRTNPYSRFGPATADRGSQGIRDQPRNPPKDTEKRIRIGFSFPCPSRG